MGQGFTVSTSTLSDGGQQVAGLVSSVESAASDVTRAITGMAGSASGHAGLASALTSTANSSTRAFGSLRAAYQHVSDSLTSAASIYDQAEQACTESASAIGGRQ
jgi:hypothetical protein